MYQINQKQVIDKVQMLYNSLVSFSDNANKNSKESDMPVAQQFWAGKSESYSTSADLLRATAAAIGIPLNIKTPVVDTESDQARREHCAADLDEHERVYHEV